VNAFATSFYSSSTIPINSTCRDNYKKKVHSAQQGAVVLNSYWSLWLLVTIILVAPHNQPFMPPGKTCCKYYDRDREWGYLIPLFWSQLQVWWVQDFHCFQDELTAFFVFRFALREKESVHRSQYFAIPVTIKVDMAIVLSLVCDCWG